MKVDILTIFPDIFFGPFSESIISRALENNIVDIKTINPRDFAGDTHKKVDDKPYGGGPGMLMKPEPIFEAVESCRTQSSHVVLTSPQGKVFTQDKAKQLSKKSHLIFICGHYEGVDERVRDNLCDEEISIGDYILTSGNLPAMVIIDAVVRLLPGVLGAKDSVNEETFTDGLLEYPQYTKPYDFRGLRVPKILSSGDHEAVKKWKRKQAENKTKEQRPDLYNKYLKNKDKKFCE